MPWPTENSNNHNKNQRKNLNYILNTDRNLNRCPSQLKSSIMLFVWKISIFFTIFLKMFKWLASMHKTGLQNSKLKNFKFKPSLILKHLKFLYIFSQYFQIEDKVHGQTHQTTWNSISQITVIFVWPSNTRES